jgi:hypothetical protein
VWPAASLFQAFIFEPRRIISSRLKVHANGSDLAKGTLSFFDNQINTATGTITFNVRQRRRSAVARAVPQCSG